MSCYNKYSHIKSDNDFVKNSLWNLYLVLNEKKNYYYEIKNIWRLILKNFK